MSANLSLPLIVASGKEIWQLHFAAYCLTYHSRRSLRSLGLAYSQPLNSNVRLQVEKSDIFSYLFCHICLGSYIAGILFCWLPYGARRLLWLTTLFNFLFTKSYRLVNNRSGISSNFFIKRVLTNLAFKWALSIAYRHSFIRLLEK